MKYRKRGDHRQATKIYVSDKAAEYLSGWKDQDGNEVSKAAALEEILSWAIEGGCEKVIGETDGR